MDERECTLYSTSGQHPDERGKADLVLTLKDGREISLCVCPSCLNDLIGILVPMYTDLKRRRAAYRQAQERRN